MTARRFGKGWDVFPAYLRGYNRGLPFMEKAMLWMLATSYLKMLRERIDSQPGDVPPLSRSWTEEKARRGLDPRIWVATGFFRDHLKAVQIAKGVIFVGATKMKHKPSGVPMEKIAEVIEYGSVEHGIPPRPLFRPVGDKFRKTALVALHTDLGMFFATGGRAIPGGKS